MQFIDSICKCFQNLFNFKQYCYLLLLGARIFIDSSVLKKNKTEVINANKNGL